LDQDVVLSTGQILNHLVGFGCERATGFPSMKITEKGEVSMCVQSLIILASIPSQHSGKLLPIFGRKVCQHGGKGGDHRTWGESVLALFTKFR
jgi:hypothetical protein